MPLGGQPPILPSWMSTSYPSGGTELPRERQLPPPPAAQCVWHQVLTAYDVLMRTTVTLDADTVALVQRRMREHGITFKQALNDAVRAGAGAARVPFQTATADLGPAAVTLDRALQLAAADEDEELLRKMRVGK